jgi:hypothetical protein
MEMMAGSINSPQIKALKTKIRTMKKTGKDLNMTRTERKTFLKKMEDTFSFLSEADQMKMDFARNFLIDLQLFDPEDGHRIKIDPLGAKTMQYLIFVILKEFTKRLESNKQVDNYYQETDKIKLQNS